MVAAISGSGFFAQKNDEVSASTVIDIDTPQDVSKITSALSSFATTVVRLNCDIDASIVTFPNLASFAGTFEGNGHIIYRLSKPLFKFVASSAAIRNVTFREFNYSSEGALTYVSAVALDNRGEISDVSAEGAWGGKRIGGIAGENRGVITNSSVIGVLTGKGNSAEIGGIAGANYGRIENSSFFGTISETVMAESTAIGGIAGRNSGQILNCAAFTEFAVSGNPNFNFGGITGENGQAQSTSEGIVFVRGIISDSLFAGGFSGGSEISRYGAGIAGRNVSSTIENSYSVINTDGITYGIIGINGTIVAYQGQEPYFDDSYEINYNFSTLDLQSNEYNSSYPLAVTNQKIIWDKAYHLDAENNLADLLNYDGESLWQGSAGGLAFLSDTILKGAGSETNPFIVKSVQDYRKIGYISKYSANNYFQNRDIDFSGYTYNAQEVFKGVYTADGFGLINLNEPDEYLFTQNQGVITGLGLINCNISGIAETGNSADFYSDFTSLGFIGSYSDITPAQPSSGSGTSEDPYVITNKKELAYISNSDEYFVLGGSVAVNSFSDKGYKLSLQNFSGKLDGKGYEIVGLLDEALVDLSTLQGEIKNLTVRGYAYAEKRALIASSVGEMGRIENVAVYGRLFGEESAGIAYLNNGRISYSSNYAILSEDSAGLVYSNGDSGVIEYCENYGDAKTAFANNLSGNAIIRNCASYGNTLSAYNEMGTLDSSVRAEASVELWHQGEMVYSAPTVPAAKLMTFDGFDLSVWKYPVNKEETVPYLRREGFFYKTDGSSIFNTTSTSMSRVYNRTTVDKNSIQLGRLSNTSYASSVEFQWYYSYEGMPELTSENLLGERLIRDAGYYVLSCVYQGTGTVFSYSFTYTITINRGTLPSPVWTWETVESGEAQILTIKGLSTQNPYIYTGDSRYIWDIAPFNYKFDLDIPEQEYSYTVRKNGNLMSYTGANLDEESRLAFDSKLTDAGTYSVSIVVNNKNYLPKDISVSYYVVPAAITINLASHEINYLDAAPAYQYTVVLERQEGISNEDYQVLAARTISAVQAFAPYSAYSIGSDAGDYQINIDFANPNYTATVNRGTLTVKKLPLSWELLQSWGVTFEDNAVVYNGYVQPLEASLGSSGVTASYTGNQNKNAGEYIVQATFEKNNYLPFSTQRILTITPAPLTVAPRSIAINYLQTPVFSLGDIAFSGDDTLSVLAGTAVFECDYQVNDNCGTYEITVEGLSSANYDIIFTPGTLTVNPIYMNGIFAPYQNLVTTYNGEPKEHTFNTGAYSVNVSYQYFHGSDLLGSAPVNVGTYTVYATVNTIDPTNYLSTVFGSSLTINKASLQGVVTYDAYYSYTYQTNPSYIPYRGVLPEQSLWTINYTIKKDTLTVASFTNAGEYMQTASFTGNPNYENHTIQTTVEILPKGISIDVANTTYMNRPVTPSVTIRENISDNLDFSFRYSLVGFETRFDNAVNAGEYVCYATVTGNPNYIVENQPTFRINKFEVNYTPRYIEYTYGDFRDDYYFEYVRYSIDRTNITEWQYFVEATSEMVESVNYTVGGWEYGIWNILSVAETANYKFVIPAGEQLGKVSVRKRELTLAWNETNVVMEYAGEKLQPFTVTVGNTYGNDTISYQLKSLGNMTTVGNHDVWAELGPAGEYKNINYIMPQSIVRLKINPAPLIVRANNVNVQRGGTPQFSATLEGLKGADTIASLNIVLVYECAYNTNTSVGAKLPINIRPFTLDQYNVTFVPGTITVVERTYSLLTLPSRSFVYDGTVKGLTFAEPVPPGTQINFFGTNYKVDAGIYQVEASIRFPDNTTQEIASTLTITKAVPIVTIEPIILPYSVVANLENNDIIGTSTLNNININGTFSFIGNREMRLGEHTYRVRFVPEDTRNIEEVTQDVLVTCRTVREEILEFESQSLILADGVIEKSGPAIMSLKGTYTETVLKVNGEEVESYALPDEGSILVEVFRRGNKLFGRTFTIRALVIEPEPEPLDIVWDESIFVLTKGAYFEGDKLILKESARISLDPELKGVFLYINGRAVALSSVVLYPDDGVLKIQIKYNDEVVYDKEITIVEEKIDSGENKDERVQDPYLWAKLLGGILGGGALLVLLFFVVRKIIRNSREEFNPYEKIRRK